MNNYFTLCLTLSNNGNDKLSKNKCTLLIASGHPTRFAVHSLECLCKYLCIYYSQGT